MPNDIEKNKINEFLADEVMRKAVEKVLISVTEVDFKEQANKLNDVELGQVVRASAQAKIYIEQGFDKLAIYLTRENTPKGKNPAI